MNLLLSLLYALPLYGALYAAVYVLFLLFFLLLLLVGGNIFPLVASQTNELIGLNSVSGWIVLLVIWAVWYLILEFVLVKKYTFTPQGVKYRSNLIHYADIAHVILYGDRIVIATIMGTELIIKNYKSEQTVMHPIREGLTSLGFTGKMWRHEPSSNRYLEY
ncbi:hypothetical protein D3P08_21665 [Paenibacillus nanensis]|uniref:Uncharacterized protein n=2 Tax=Paenibacillus nanensis TaxID=393251 RepID=A0A3A1UNQ0_9BACL|nr:hypothetical protein D3P08_21665 [Paenibacillus nanensis]